MPDRVGVEAAAENDVDARLECRDTLRSVVTAGLTPQQYQETIRTLAAMAANVEAAIAARRAGAKE